MKKILSLLTAITLTVSGTTSVVGCNKQTYNKVTQEQETKALNNFLKQNENKLPTGFITNCKLTFKNNDPIKDIQKIDFTVLGTKNLTNNKDQLIAKYQGTMSYNLKNKTFNLIGHPFDNKSYAPGFFNPGLGVQSMISGNPNDFTIVANSAILYDFSERIAKGDPIAANTTQELFNDMDWNNVSEFNTDPNFLIELNNLYSKFQASYWKVPGGYMGLIHIKKINGVLQILWSNLNNDQEKQSLQETGIEGFITNILWKKTTTENHLYISKSLLLTFYQLKEQQSNDFLNNKNIFFNWIKQNNTDKNDGIYLTKNSDISNQYNTNKEELWNGLNNLFNNWNTYKTNINNLLTDSKQYKAYDLVFNKNNNNWIFDINNSKGLGQTL